MSMGQRKSCCIRRYRMIQRKSVMDCEDDENENDKLGCGQREVTGTKTD